MRLAADSFHPRYKPKPTTLQRFSADDDNNDDGEDPADDDSNDDGEDPADDDNNDDGNNNGDDPTLSGRATRDRLVQRYFSGY